VDDLRHLEKLRSLKINNLRELNVRNCETQADLVNGLDSTCSNGQVWLTVPPLGEAVGPIPLPDYIAHRSQVTSVPALAALGAKRIDPSTLPPC
jgi:hypothetical protein